MILNKLYSHQSHNTITWCAFAISVMLYLRMYMTAQQTTILNETKEHICFNLAYWIFATLIIYGIYSIALVFNEIITSKIKEGKKFNSLLVEWHDSFLFTTRMIIFSLLVWSKKIDTRNKISSIYKYSIPEHNIILTEDDIHKKKIKNHPLLEEILSAYNEKFLKEHLERGNSKCLQENIMHFFYKTTPIEIKTIGLQATDISNYSWGIYKMLNIYGFKCKQQDLLQFFLDSFPALRKWSKTTLASRLKNTEAKIISDESIKKYIEDLCIETRSKMIEITNTYQVIPFFHMVPKITHGSMI